MTDTVHKIYLEAYRQFAAHPPFPFPIADSPPSFPLFSRPVVLYDADCDLCLFWVGHWRAHCGDRMEIFPYQEASDRFPFLKRQDLEKALHLIEPDGQLYKGAAAVIRLRELALDRHRLARAYRNHQWFAACCEWGYRRIALNRRFFAGLTRRMGQGKSA